MEICACCNTGNGIPKYPQPYYQYSVLFLFFGNSRLVLCRPHDVSVSHVMRPICWLILSRPVSFPNLNSTSRNLMHCDWHSTTPGLKYYWLLALISGNNICAKQQEHWAADNNSKAISH